MQESDESAKRAVELVRIFKELPPEDQAAILELAKSLRERLQE